MIPAAIKDPPTNTTSQIGLNTTILTIIHFQLAAGLSLIVTVCL